MRNLLRLGAGIAVISAAFIGQNAHAQALWNFGTTAANASPSSGVPISNLTVSDVSFGNSFGTVATPINSQSTSSGYTGASAAFNAGNAVGLGALNPATSAYIQFTLTPDAGFQAQLTDINFGSRSTGTGPQLLSIRTSIDNFATTLTSVSVVNDSVWRFLDLSPSTVTGATGAPLTVRIYGSNGTGTPGSGTINWRIDDLSVSAAAVGATAVVPEANTFALASVGMLPLAAVAVRRRKAA